VDQTLIARETPRLKLRDIPPPPQVAGDPIRAAKLTSEMMAGAAWRQLLEPLLADIDRDRDRDGRRGPKTLFSSRELESVFLFGWLLGQPAAKDARLALLDSTKARQTLGFEQPRGGVRGSGSISSGLPSEPSLSRHRQRVGDERRLKLYAKLLQSR
jgi:hypothetical protein